MSYQLTISGHNNQQGKDAEVAAIAREAAQKLADIEGASGVYLSGSTSGGPDAIRFGENFAATQK